MADSPAFPSDIADLMAGRMTSFSKSPWAMMTKLGLSSFPPSVPNTVSSPIAF